jgi:hypothetical protein
MAFRRAVVSSGVVSALLVNVVSFNGGAETDKHLASMLGMESSLAKTCDCHGKLKYG